MNKKLMFKNKKSVGGEEQSEASYRVLSTSTHVVKKYRFDFE
jgi:hypothetical protein